MSSRNLPPSPSDSRYGRDRSPRFAERRPSAPHGGPLAARITEPSQRSSNSHGYSSGGRDPPRGPKALLAGPRQTTYPPRGMRFAGRGESRGRDFRTPIDGPGARRELDRDWDRRGRIDSRERRVSPVGRNRSRSPLARDFRDARDFSSRELDVNRASRGPRDAPLSASSSVSDALTSANSNATGIPRGRSGLGWEHSKSSRANYPEEREGFRNRSWSRERQWDKRGRDERELRDIRDHDFGRREDDLRKEGEERGRDIDRHKRDVPSLRPESRNSSGAQLTPTTPVSASALSAHQANPDRAGSVEPAWRPPAPVAPSLTGSARESDRNETLLSRTDRDRPALRMRSPPPQAPEVPAFGSIPTSQSVVAFKDGPKEDGYLPEVPRSLSRDGEGEMPSGLKSRQLSKVPTGPKGVQQLEKNPHENAGTVERRPDIDRDRYGFAHLLGSSVKAPITEEPRGEHRFDTIHGSSHLRGANQNPSGKESRLSTSPGASRPKSLPTAHPASVRDIEDVHRLNPPPRPNMITTGKPVLQDTTNIQTSPIKIPTGPRAERNAPTTRPPIPSPIRGPPARPLIPPRQSRPSNLKWIRPGLQSSRAPSIMNIVPTKRDYVGEEKQRNLLASREPIKLAEPLRLRPAADTKSDFIESDPENREQAEPSDSKTDVEMEEATEEAQASDEINEPQSPSNAISEIKKSSDTDMDVDYGLADFDDEEYAQEERKYEISMQALEAKLPATPRHHPRLLSLLDECDALASVAEDLSRTTEGGSSGGGVSAESLPLGLPSPKLEENDKPGLEDHPMVTASPVKTGRHTPLVESLPFLAIGPPTPFSELEEIQQISLHHDVVHARIVDILGNQREQLDSENEEIRVEYAKRYKEWRILVEAREHLKKAENPATTAPVSPTPASAPLVVPIEGRRAAKNTSEFDLERVLRESAVTAQEDQDRRNREKNFIDLEKEAEIPQMLHRHEIESSNFLDRNNWIETYLVLDAFCFIPPPDDFTPKEQEIFLENYLTSPKKWGTIAAALKGRDYQDCVRHYYHTKGEAQYKEKEKVFIRIRKNRKGVRGPQQRPKSTALITPYDGTMEFDTPQVPVTDTGRPRRAAAPTFGDVVEGEVAPSTVTTPARRNGTAVKPDTNGETHAEKPSQRRGRTASVKEKPPKKGKTPLIAAAPAPTAPSNGGDLQRAKSREPKIEGDQRIEELEGAQVLAGLQSSQPSLGVSQSGPSDTWLDVQPPRMTTPIFISKPPPQQVGSEVQNHLQPSKATQSGTSSYWSVPEQTDFQNLVQHFGTDWHAIAAHMKSKTHTMVYDLYFILNS